MHTKEYRKGGMPISAAGKVLIMLHGRGGSAEDIMSLSSYLNTGDYSLIAPSAMNNTWYPYSFMAPVSANEPWLSSAIKMIDDTVEDITKKGVPATSIYFLGFSQGACLTLEYVAQNAKQYGGVVAFTGGLIGEQLAVDNYRGDFEKTPILICTSDPDPHVPVSRVKESTSILKTLKAEVTEKVYNNMGHTITQDEIKLANQLVFI